MTDFDSNIRVAALVLGSNSFRMTIAEISDRISINTLAQENMLIQAGKDSLMTGKLDNATMKRGWECVDLLRRIALAHQVNRIYAVATGAIWEAENGKEFIRRIGTKYGIVADAKHTGADLDLHIAQRRARDFEKLFDVETTFIKKAPSTK